MRHLELTEEVIAEYLGFMFNDGLCPGCKLLHSKITGLVDYVNMGVWPSQVPCPVCICVPEGTPAR